MSQATEVHPAGRTLEEWEALLGARGEPRFRARQIFQWIHGRGVFEPEQMTDLARALREQLALEGTLAPAVIDEVRRSADGTRKILLRLHDALRVECVLIPMSPSLGADADIAAIDEDDEPASEQELRRRVTLCVSTQVGCAMGCVFCASGQAGLTRGLGAHEIMGQVLLAKQLLDPDEHLRNIVFMGMGEPLHHYEQTRRAIALLTHPAGFGMSPRRITVSTVGLVPGIRKLGEDFGGKLGLAVSLHAPDNETRDQIMPMNKRFDVSALIAALRAYPLPKRRRITIEYTLIADLNDSEAHARRLVRTLRGLRVKVNLIPMNPIEQSDLGAPRSERVDAFRATLLSEGVSCSVRTRRGDDVDAACGQLALRRSHLIAATQLAGPGRKN